MLANRLKLANRSILLLAVLLGGIGMFAESAFAQMRRYQPKRPTTSAYHNLTRFNTGAVPNYYSLVRPAQRQQAYNQKERSLRKRQAGSITRLQSNLQLETPPAKSIGSQGGFFVPSSRSTFRSSGYYFRTNSVVVKR